MKVEFRLLQVVLSAVSGDRVTVALVHWDGTRMRVASSPTALTVVDAPSREGIRAAVEDYVRKAQRRARQLEKTPELNIGLAHAFPVREGMGAALCWTPISSRETRDAEAHFLELRSETRLVHEPLQRMRRVPPAPAHIVPKEEETSVQTLTKGLGNFGELLKWLAIAYVAHEFLGR